MFTFVLVRFSGTYLKDLTTFWTVITVTFVMSIVIIVFSWVWTLIMWQRRNMAEAVDFMV